MRKTPALIALLASAALASAGCEADPASSSSSAKTTVPSSEETTLEEETDAATTEPATEAEEEKTTSAPDTNEEKDPSVLAGYWYIDGDPSTASIHFKTDGTFETFYASGSKETEGTYDLDAVKTTGEPGCVLFTNDGKYYLGFPGEFSAETNSITDENGTFTFVRLYGEGGLGDDGRAPYEELLGSWNCDRASLAISEDYSDGSITAVIWWGDGAMAHAEWVYPLTADGDKLVCSGNGIKRYVEYKEGQTDPTVTVEYSDGGAEFELRDGGICWNDLKENRGAGMIFQKVDDDFAP